MKIQELRIGNYVIGNYDKGFECDCEIEECQCEMEQAICKVVLLDSVGYTDYSIWIESKDTDIDVFESFEPIPITEEWLLKFGKIEWLSKDIDGFFYWFNGEKKYLKFIHSLQNTYFCIEQKELL